MVIELPPLIKALLSPSAYPEATSTVQLIQTQMSFVMLTDQFAYKIKKPVNLGYLDYTTLAKRRYYCKSEVALNRRLCPDVYLGVVPITQNKGDFAIEGNGRVAEYAVKMLRLPEDMMLDRLLTNKRVSYEMIERLADKIANFHRSAVSNKYISRFGSLKQIGGNNEENFIQLAPYANRIIETRMLHLVRDFTKTFITQNETSFRRRVDNGKIKDCHGDLHASHICFTDGICIYDCIEFNNRFRYADTTSEIAFLVMDLDHFGRADLGHHLLEEYINESNDMDIRSLLRFYKCYRACVRAKVDCFQTDDPYLEALEKEAAAKRASSYLDLAFAYTWTRPKLFITTGFTGTGKSTLAESLSKQLGLVLISSDVTRKHLAGIPEIEHHFGPIGCGIYSPSFTELTYQTMFEQAREYLRKGQSVILDASFIRREYRRKAQELAQALSASFYILECRSTDIEVRQRLSERMEGRSISDGRWEVYLAQKQDFEPIEEEADGYAIIDTSQPIEDILHQVIQLLLEETRN